MATEARVLFYGGKTLEGDDRIETALDIATTRLGDAAATWGDLFDEAVACLAAHTLLCTPSKGDGKARGQLLSEKRGNGSSTYSNLGAGLHHGDASLMTTAPGRAFLEMRASLSTVGIAVLC